MSDIWTTSWSETDASNSQTPPEGWPPGMAANAVEPSARMNMGAVKRFWNRINPVYVATLSTTDTYTVSPSVAPPGYGLYELWRVRMPSANTATSPTINISSLGPRLLKKYSASSITALTAGDIQPRDHSFYDDGTRLILRDPFIPSATAPGPITNSLGADVNLNNAANYFDGPSITLGVGTWAVIGSVTVGTGASSADFFDAKLWDGTTVLDSRRIGVALSSYGQITLQGIVTNPAGAVKISVQDPSSTNGVIKFNVTGNSKDSTIMAYRIA